MICPSCKNINAPKEVLDTWILKNGSVRRKRKCSRCKVIFQTVEMVLATRGAIMYGLHNSIR